MTKHLGFWRLSFLLALLIGIIALFDITNILDDASNAIRMFVGFSLLGGIIAVLILVVFAIGNAK